MKSADDLFIEFSSFLEIASLGGGMDYRRVEKLEDFQQIVELQNKNLRSTLSDLEQIDGFLSVAFSIEQFQEMNNDLCVMACFDNERICGYLVASSIELNKKFPLVAAMIDCFSEISYKNKLLINYQPFISGPICIDRNYRGRGIFKKLIASVLNFLLQQSDSPGLLTVFVSSDNLRSVNAHKKIGMDVVGEFTFNNQVYLILVMPLSRR